MWYYCLLLGVLQGSPQWCLVFCLVEASPLPAKTRQSFSNGWGGNKNIQFVGVSLADKLVFNLPGLGVGG